MTDIEIYQDGDKQKTNSKNIAGVFGRTHRNVLRDISNLDCSDKFRALNFEQSTYTSEQNKVLDCVEMTKDGFIFLCMGYRGEKAAAYKEMYIEEFNRMANSLNSIALRAARLEAEKKEITEAGREWAKLGHEVRKSKGAHNQKTKELMDEVQLKIEF